MPWRGFEPRRLSAPPPQDGVSTSFTTRALLMATGEPENHLTGPTGLEPATSRVTVECSNQTELRPQLRSCDRASCNVVLRGPAVAPTGIEPVSPP